MTEAEADFEIEYLDEDEDVVQQCVQTPVDPAPVALSTIAVSPRIVKVESVAPSTSLLVERVGKPAVKRKRKKGDDDSDYDPKGSKDDDEEYDPAPRRYKKKLQAPTPKHVPIAEKKFKHANKRDEIQYRRELGIKIPNFEDPLCLPVKVAMNDEAEVRKLKTWNNLCLNNFKNHDTFFKPDKGETVGSQRAVVLRKVKNKLTGKNETTIWTKLTVHSKVDKKSEVFQSILPKYREAKLLDFSFSLGRRLRPVRSVETVVLTKEEDKGDIMVAYNPKQAVSAVYRLMEENRDETAKDNTQDDKKQYLQELTVCNICAPCFQSSWRGFRKTVKKKSVVCPICLRTFVSVYNLLAHVKTHNASDIQNNKKLLNKTLASVVDYHYKCRICQEKCESIKELRKHVVTHQSPDQFQCEICNRVVKSSINTSFT